MLSARLIALALAALLTGAIERPAPGGDPWTASEITALQQTIGGDLGSPAFAGAQVGLDIVDTQRGVPLFSQNATQEFMPASNMKLLTGSAALQQLGPQFSFDTAVLADVNPVNGIVAGNLYLRGGGDAQLSVRDLENAAQTLAAVGIEHVTGALLIDTAHYDAARFCPGWQLDDVPYYYAPALSALELEDGVVHVRVTPGSQIGAPAQLDVSPQSGAYSIDNRIITGPRGSKDTTDVVRPWNRPLTIELTGSYPLGSAISDDLAPSVPDPAAYAGDVFARALAAHGIDVAEGVRQGDTPASARELWDRRSAALPKLLANMWLPSDNLMAEMFLKELGAQQSTPGTSAAGIRVLRTYLRSAGVDPATVSISDGSGLSAYDRITPADLVAILQSDWNGPYRETVLDALPIAGVRGTLKYAYAGTPAEGAVFAKTGSWTHATTLSGYVQTRTHGPVTFSFLINEWVGDDRDAGAAAVAKARAAILSAVAEQ